VFDKAQGKLARFVLLVVVENRIAQNSPFCRRRKQGERHLLGTLCQRRSNYVALGLCMMGRKDGSGAKETDTPPAPPVETTASEVRDRPPGASLRGPDRDGV